MKVFLTKEAQDAMMALIKRAKGKKVEYGLQLILEGDRVYPGNWKWGAPEKIRSSFSGIGWFHTHPRWYTPFSHHTYDIMGWKYPQPQPPSLSTIDFIHILISPEHKLIGVGAPDYSEQVVQFANLKRKVPIRLKASLLRAMPLIAMTNAPFEGLEGYYNMYDFELDEDPFPMEVYLG